MRAVGDSGRCGSTLIEILSFPVVVVVSRSKLDILIGVAKYAANESRNRRAVAHDAVEIVGRNTHTNGVPKSSQMLFAVDSEVDNGSRRRPDIVKQVGDESGCHRQVAQWSPTGTITSFEMKIAQGDIDGKARVLNE